jgi:DNA-directed RNA polymerase specialized sigma24 family protein
MAAISEDDREVLLFRHVADLSFRQIAEILGEPRSTIASRYTAALDRIRSLLSISNEVTHV